MGTINKLEYGLLYSVSFGLGVTKGVFDERAIDIPNFPDELALVVPPVAGVILSQGWEMRKYPDIDESIGTAVGQIRNASKTAIKRGLIGSVLCEIIGYCVGRVAGKLY